MPAYFDCNATTPIEPQVLNTIRHYLEIEFGNAGSRTHSYGVQALQAVQKARDQVAAVVKAKRDEVIFTSGATESNNLAILGLVKHGEITGRRHIISSLIEHKAVLEPLEALRNRGFEITLISPNSDGIIEINQLNSALRSDTLLVSIMHVNNETGVIQPIVELAECLKDHDTFFHVDAAQGFGKVLPGLDSKRIDLISISGHKIFAPKGIGALIMRRRGYKALPLEPIMYGGGQERGLRPGTLPVHLIAGLGEAAEIAVKDNELRIQTCKKIKETILSAFMPLTPVINGVFSDTASHTLSIAFPGLDSEAVIVALKNEIALSNGSACTSSSYQPSHVLKAMQLKDDVIQGTLRLSWCHLSESVDWQLVASKIRKLM
ncbi:MAG: cysteine desulfurase DndA [Chlorobium sp.]|nr:cysteine desulfurase DndA [Chlorobium sp.]